MVIHTIETFYTATAITQGLYSVSCPGFHKHIHKHIQIHDSQQITVTPAGLQTHHHVAEITSGIAVGDNFRDCYW